MTNNYMKKSSTSEKWKSKLRCISISPQTEWLPSGKQITVNAGKDAEVGKAVGKEP
jgi:hypothetical protein